MKLTGETFTADIGGGIRQPRLHTVTPNLEGLVRWEPGPGGNNNQVMTPFKHFEKVKLDDDNGYVSASPDATHFNGA